MVQSLRERWDAYDAQPTPHPILDPLWQRAEEDWQDERRHQALAAVVTTDWTALSALSQRYNAVLRQRPGDAMAKQSMDRLIQLALLLPAPTKAEDAALPAQALRGAAFLLLLLASLGLVLSLWRKMG